MIDDVTQVRRLLVSEDDPALTPDAQGDQARADELLLERVLGTSLDQPDPPRRRVPPRRAALAAAGLGCAVALALTITSWPVGDGGARAALPIRAAVVPSASAKDGVTARSVLETAAVAAARKPDVALGDVQYQRVMAGYLRIVGGQQPASVLAPETVETWWTADGSREIRHEGAAPIWPSEADRQAWDASGAPVPDTTRTDRLKGADVDAGRYSADRQILAAQLRRELADNSGDRTARTLARLRDIRNAGASPALEAAAFRVAAGLPGIEVFGQVTDQLGRSGVAVGIDSSYSGKRTRYEMIVSSDGELLQYQELLLEPASFIRARPPVQIAFEIEVERGVAPSVGSRP